MALINFRHLSRAGFYALAGLRRALAAEQAFRHEALLLPVVIILLLIIRPGAAWFAALVSAWLLVMAVELLNSAIEEAFNLISPEYNIHVKYGKDMASGAVLVTLCINAVLWACMLISVFWP